MEAFSYIHVYHIVTLKYCPLLHKIAYDVYSFTTYNFFITSIFNINSNLFSKKIIIIQTHQFSFSMALHINSGCFTVMGHCRVQRVKAVASEGSAANVTFEDKLKLGGSDLKVSTIGIGAWSWGDTTYWNNFQWNGNFFFFPFFFLFLYSFSVALHI